MTHRSSWTTSQSLLSQSLLSPSIAALVLASCLAPSAVESQEPHILSNGDPEDVGMSAAVLAGAVGLYEETVARGDLVGAVVLVARKGRIVVHEAFGWRDKELRLPMERNTLFRMASNTKPVVATAIAQLVEEGRLDYDDLVREYLPEWDNYRSGFITIGHLLSHTAGLRIPTLFVQPLMEPTPEHPNAPTLQLEASRFGSVGAEVPPGESYSYSNPGFNTLGALIEIAGGEPLEDRLGKTIYGPLGMDDSYNHRKGHELGGKLDHMGAVYYERSDEGGWKPGGTPGGPVAYPFSRASGGMISTAWDYAIFCQMFLNGGIYGGVRILAPQTVQLMTSPKARVSGMGEDATYYGYGWRLANGTFGHGGSDGTNAWVDPGRGVIGLVFTQTPRGENPLNRFRQLVNLSIKER